MKTSTISGFCFSLVACAADGGSAPVAAPAASVEAALHAIDVGDDLERSRATLQRAVADNVVTGDARDDAELAIAVAYRGAGDDDHAVTTLEAMIARHGRGGDWSRQQDVTRLLVRWLTGVDRGVRRPPLDIRALPVAPIAHALAKTIPRTSKERIDISVARFGGDETSEKLGTFELDTAIKQDAEDACPLCEQDTSTHTSASGYPDWTGIPIEAEGFADLLAVFYYDQESGGIPARYDAYLPMPVAAIEARLRDGKGFYAVKQRPGAPALVLFAAPRRAQLAAVESAFAIRSELPTEPVSVDVPRGLTPREIRASVRGSLGAFRACYETLPAPRPTGTFELDFAIDGAGLAKNVIAGTGTTLRDATFARCMTTAASAMKFSALGGSGDTTVRYPVAFSPYAPR